MEKKISLKNKLRHLFYIGAMSMIMLLTAAAAQAATLFMVPQNGQLQAGQTFTVDLLVNSTDQGFNAAQATIQFPTNVLSVKSIDSSASGSAFNFWLDGPTFSNSTGIISFIGGTTNAIVGGSIKILRITFVVRGSGDANIIISDSAVTAADGSGTNILSAVGSAKFTVIPGTIAVTTSTAPVTSAATTTAATTESGAATGAGATTAASGAALPPSATPAVVLPPVQIVRKAEAAIATPVVPAVSIPFYPDQTKWYNQVSNFLVQWHLPADITDVSSVLNSSYAFTPASASEGLFDAKAFNAAKDGIWFLHVKFKNNKGWGAAAHYRIAIDTEPPLPFTIESAQGLSTDDPQPILSFKTSDALSGLAYYGITVDQQAEFFTTSTEATLPLLAPGQRVVIIKAVDNAGNVRENSINLNIIPIAAPVIKAVSQYVYTNEGDISINGTSLADSKVRLRLTDKNGTILTALQVQADSNGNWSSQFSGPFKKGSYYIEVTVEDARGALSLPVKSSLLNIKVKPLLTLGGFGITQGWFFFLLIVIILGTFGAGWQTYSLWRAQLSRRAVIAQRDVVNVFNNIEKDLDKVIADNSLRGKHDPVSSEIKFILNNVKRNLAKARRYIVDNIKQIGE
ncbi:MAG: hypothetical protein WCO55_01010 [Candidatus Falkowbacteria bacterium]